MKNKIIFLFLVCLKCISPCFGDLSSKALIVGTNAEFPPFTFIEKGAIVGFDIDVAKEVATRLGKDIQFKDMPFDSLVPDLILGRVDFVAAGMSYTQERAQRVNFTKAYLKDDPLIALTLSESEKESFSLDVFQKMYTAKKIVVNEGFSADMILTPLKGFQLIRLGTTADGFLALKSGRADVFVTAKSTVEAFLETQKNQKFYQTLIEGTSDDCALVVSKKYPEMLEKIQRVLDTMQADGTIATLKTKWKFS